MGDPWHGASAFAGTGNPFAEGDGDEVYTQSVINTRAFIPSSEVGKAYPCTSAQKKMYSALKNTGYLGL